ncbi:MAG: hypothetical protein ABIY55_01870 [Kofleriaceae bacterium]
MKSALPPAPDVEAFYATLWARVAYARRGLSLRSFPDDLDEVAMQFFSLFKPVAKA